MSDISNTLYGRLLDVLRKEKVSLNSLAKRLGFTQSKLYKQLNGEVKITGETLEVLAAAFPEVSFDWVIRGEGPMYRTSKPEAGHAVSGTGNAVGVSAGGSVTVSATQPEAASLKAEVERLRAVIECKDGEIAFLRGALTARKE